MRAHEPADAGERAARADSDDHRIDLALHLLQQFGTGRRLVGQRVRRIFELVDIDRARRALRDRGRQVLVIVGVALADIGPREHHLGAHRARMQNFFARHLVGHHEQRAVAFSTADQG